ncbi:MAG: pirin family protein [Dehalococcoidia bacterium]
MTIEVRRDSEIYSKEGGWFSARWHFSFDDYRDPENMGFGPLRVFNDDRLIAGADWPMHPHRDIEGITYVVEGRFEHLDSLGNDGQLPPGSIQRATLGSGMYHSERNGSKTEPMRFLQFWILPDTADLTPENVQRVFTKEDRTDRLLKVIGPDGGPDKPWEKVHQDATVHIASLSPGVEVNHEIGAGRGVYLYLISGDATLNGERLTMGDAAKVKDESSLSIKAGETSELILVDIPLEWTPVGVWAGLRT